MSIAIEGLDRPAITLPPGEGRADSSLKRLTIGGQPFFVLKQRGRFPDIAYDHARLLAPEVEAGAFPEIIATIARGVNLESETLTHVAGAIYRCYSDRVLRNCSREFRDAVEAFAVGYRDGIGQPKFTDLQVRDALIAIEVGNIIDGLSRIFAMPVVRALRAPAVLALVLPVLGDPDAKAYAAAAQGGDTAKQKDVGAALQAMAGPDTRIDFACTGFAVPAGLASGGLHLHARNLDADLYNWNTAPVLSLIDETADHPGWHKYAAFGTAGLIYPGGISGLNDKGFAASLHQMSTTELESGFLGTGDIAPFTQQRMLRECSSVDDAVDLARDANHFAAWTFFVSDAKTGKVARIEVNGDGAKSVRYEGEAIAQTNHFLHPDWVERHFDEDDAHFTGSFGRWIDTHARLDSVKAALAADAGHGRIDVDWSIEWLASSRDHALEAIRQALPNPPDPLAAERAYGHVPRKVYGQLGSIVLADPQRRSWRDEVWMTTGDRLPSPHSSFLGWQVDWQGFDLNPLADRPVRRVAGYREHGRRNWEESLTRYVWARLAVARPRDSDGSLLRRRTTAEEKLAGLEGAVHLLSSAIDLAAADRIVEVPYHYMRARFRHAAGNHAGAEADWRLLRAIWAWQHDEPAIAADWPVSAPRVMPLMHPYEGALVALLSTVTDDLLQGSTGWDGRAERLAKARALFEQVKAQYFGNKRAHFDLEAWFERLEEIEAKGGGAVELPDPIFTSAE